MGNTYTAGANDYIIFHTGNDEELQNLILDMYLECINQNSYFEMMLDTQLSMLFGKLLRHYENSCELPPFTNRTDSQVFGMIQFLHQNYRDISLTALARKFHYTPEYTSKLIHDATGRTFSTLLTQIRMEQASRLLHNTTLTVADIGMQVGYTTPEHFIRTFKKTIMLRPVNIEKTGEHSVCSVPQFLFYKWSLLITTLAKPGFSKSCGPYPGLGQTFASTPGANGVWNGKPFS